MLTLFIYGFICNFLGCGKEALCPCEPDSCPACDSVMTAAAR